MSLLRKMLMEKSIEQSVIFYTSTDGNIVKPQETNFLDDSNNILPIISNTYENGQGKIIFNGKLASIGFNVYAIRNTLMSVIMPNTINSLGNRAFYYCDNMVSIETLENVVSIGDNAFYGCKSLTNVTIGSKLSSIGKFAFRNCSNLVSIIIKAVSPPTTNDSILSIFVGTHSSFKIYVPAESVDVYKTTKGWKDYASIIQAIP